MNIRSTDSDIYLNLRSGGARQDVTLDYTWFWLFVGFDSPSTEVQDKGARERFPDSCPRLESGAVAE